MKRPRSSSKTKTPAKGESSKQAGTEARPGESRPDMPLPAAQSPDHVQAASASDMQQRSSTSESPRSLGGAERGPQANDGSDATVAPGATQDVSAGPTSESQRGEEDPDRRRRRIAERAYTIYERRGREDGKALEHWLEAEREMSHAAKPSDHQWDH